MKTFKGFEKGTSDGGFEKASKYLLEKLGYDNCKLTKATCDDGVDILATKNAVDFCVQCKNYDNKVGNDKIRDFGAAIKLYGRTNGIFMTTSSFTSEAIKTAKRLGIELWDYSHIKTLSNNLGFDLETLTPTRNRHLKSVVFEHNKPVYEQMKQMLSDYGKAIVTMGTGIGKTTTALEYCIENNCRALVVCPTNIVRDSWKNNKTNKDDRLLDTTTYQAFAKVYKDIDYNEYGVVIFDEVHHGGAETWGAGIKYLMENNIKVIGLTATEERTDGINVAEVLFDNHIAEGLDILEGIKEGIIYPFTYVGALYNAEQVCQAEKDKYGDKLTELLLGKLDMALNNTKNVRDIVRNNMPKGKRKGIIFSADIESMDDDIKFIKKIYPKVEIKKLHSNMSYNEQKEVKEWFANTKSGYICTIAMVNEGAHYEGVNTIFMLRKTTSELIFLQQLGRAITSVYGHKDPHTIVFDLVNSSKAIQNIKKKFRETGVEEFVKAIEVTEEQYDAIVEAIDNGVIAPVENDDTIEISSKDISILTEATDVKIDLEKEKEHKKARELTRTIYVKDKVDFNTDYGKSKQIIVKDYSKPIVEVIEEIHNKFDSRPWTEKELNILKSGFPIKGVFIYKDIGTRTKSQCRSMATKLGLHAPDDLWNEYEDKLIVDFYPEEGASIQKRLQGRSKSAIQSRASKLGVKINKCCFNEEDDKTLIELFEIFGQKSFNMIPDKTKNSCRERALELNLLKSTSRWTDEEKEIIVKYYPAEGAEVFKRLQGRTKGACNREARELGVKFGKNKKYWSNEQIKQLIELYPQYGSNCYTFLSGFTKDDVILKARQLKLKYNKRCKWDEKEIQILLEKYPLIGIDVKSFLPDKTITQIQTKVKNLGITILNTNKVTDEEKDLIIEFYPVLGKDITSKLPNRSLGVIQAVAQKLGVKYTGKPKGNVKPVKCEELNKVYHSSAEAGREIGISASGITLCCKGKAKTAGGYHWKYAEK